MPTRALTRGASAKAARLQLERFRRASGSAQVSLPANRQALAAGERQCRRPSRPQRHRRRGKPGLDSRERLARRARAGASDHLVAGRPGDHRGPAAEPGRLDRARRTFAPTTCIDRRRSRWETRTQAGPWVDHVRRLYPDARGPHHHVACPSGAAPVREDQPRAPAGWGARLRERHHPQAGPGGHRPLELRGRLAVASRGPLQRIPEVGDPAGPGAVRPRRHQPLQLLRAHETDHRGAADHAALRRKVPDRKSRSSTSPASSSPATSASASISPPAIGGTSRPGRTLDPADASRRLLRRAAPLARRRERQRARRRLPARGRPGGLQPERAATENGVVLEHRRCRPGAGRVGACRRSWIGWPSRCAGDPKRRWPEAVTLAQLIAAEKAARRVGLAEDGRGSTTSRPGSKIARTAARSRIGWRPSATSRSATTPPKMASGRSAASAWRSTRGRN